MTVGRMGRAAAGFAVAVTIFLVTGELLARGLGLVDKLNGYARQLFERGPYPDLPYRLRPGVEVAFGGTRVRVNRLGLRGAEVTPDPPAGTVRILVLGDSVVFGQGVDEEATVSAGLARALAARWKLPVEALNAGAQGYDTVAEAAYLAGPGRTLGASGVVVGMSLNDYDRAPAYDATGVLTRHDAADGSGPLARSEFLLLLRWLRAWSRGELMTQMLERRAGDEPKSQPNTEPVPSDGTSPIDRLVAAEHLRFYRNPDPTLWARLRGGLIALRDTAAVQGQWLAIAVFPESWQLAATGADMTPQQKLLALCDEVQVRCIDLAPAFHAAGGSLFQDTQHPNAQGLAVAAAAVAAAL